MPRTIVVMPAYNAESTLEKTLAELPDDTVDEIILVDDCSQDGTVALAKQLGLTVIEHEQNLGYGGNQKSCYRLALERGADIVVMLHPDLQYDAKVVPVMIDLLSNDHCDVLLGNRIRTRREALAGGMPVYKYIANRALTAFENIWLGQNLGEFHSGLRAYTREVLTTIPWELNSDDFVFDTQFLVQSVHFGFRLGDVPVPVRYMKDASSINFMRSTTYGTMTLWTLFEWTLHQTRLMQSPRFEARS